MDNVTEAFVERANFVKEGLVYACENKNYRDIAKYYSIMFGMNDALELIDIEKYFNTPVAKMMRFHLMIFRIDYIEARKALGNGNI